MVAGTVRATMPVGTMCHECAWCPAIVNRESKEAS